MNKRTLAAVLVLTLCLLSACGRRKTPEPAVSSSQEETILKLDTLAVELPRDLDTATARKAMAALPELLAPEGVEVEELSVTFGTSHAATIQALEDGGVDLAFLPASDFVRLSRDAVPVLGESLRVEICAGPSDYGAQLAKQAERRDLTWTELDRARWGVLAEDSDGGYRCLELWLEDRYEGDGVADLSDVTIYDDWETLLRAASEEEIDLFPLPEEMAADGQSIGETEPLFTWVAAVTPEWTELQTARFRTALVSALENAFDSPETARAAIGAADYAPMEPSDLDGLRRLEFGN